MPNEKGWYTREEVIETGLPYWIPQSSRWSETPYQFAILLTKSRCNELGCPILSNGHEKPSAFRLSALEKSEHKFIPLYDRTDMKATFCQEKVWLEKHEAMGKWEGLD